MSDNMVLQTMSVLTQCLATGLVNTATMLI